MDAVLVVVGAFIGFCGTVVGTWLGAWQKSQGEKRARTEQALYGIQEGLNAAYSAAVEASKSNISVVETFEQTDRTVVLNNAIRHMANLSVRVGDDPLGILLDAHMKVLRSMSRSNSIEEINAWQQQSNDTVRAVSMRIASLLHGHVVVDHGVKPITWWRRAAARLRRLAGLPLRFIPSKVVNSPAERQGEDK